MSRFALLRFATPDARRRYFDALRNRMYGAGYTPDYVTDYIRKIVADGGVISNDDIERVCTVASGIRGVVCKIVKDEREPSCL